MRLPVMPDESNGLDRPSRLMVDKITTIPRIRLGQHLGRLADQDMIQLERALVVVMGLA